MKKGRSGSGSPDLISDFYNHLIKTLEREKLEYENTKQSVHFSLAGDE